VAVPLNYTAVSDRVVRTVPTLPTLGAAPYAFTDPTYGTRMVRVSDANTLGGSASLRSLGGEGNTQAWSLDSKYFVLTSTSGGGHLFSFNPVTMAVAYVRQLNFNASLGMSFSPTDNDLMYGNDTAYTTATISSYRISTNAYTKIVDVRSLVSHVDDGGRTYVRGICVGVKNGVDYIGMIFGGVGQGWDHYAVVFPASTPSSAVVLDTLGSTVGGSLPFVPTYSKNVLATPETGFWRLNDAVASSNAADSSGNGNTGTVNGTVTFGQTSPFAETSTAALFDGTSGKITLPSLTYGANVSVEAWIKTTANTQRAILSNRSNSFGDTGNLFIGATAAGTILAYEDEGGGHAVTSTGTVNDGNWHHVVVTSGLLNGTMTTTIYIDGSQDTQAAQTRGTRTGVVYIGWDLQQTTNYWNGSLCAVALYPSILGGGLVSSHYATGRAVGSVTSSAIGPIGIFVHGNALDMGGRYECLGPDDGNSIWVWDTQTNSMTQYLAAPPDEGGGHGTVGFGTNINLPDNSDGTETIFRTLAAPHTTRQVISPTPTPANFNVQSHPSWSNSQPTGPLVPVLTEFYRNATLVGGVWTADTGQWREWDGEIVAIRTDGIETRVWRFCHHRSDYNTPDNPNGEVNSFWYTPRPNISPDGRWAVFTSNWQKTLGTDTGDTYTQGTIVLPHPYRQDSFIVELPASVTSVDLTTATLSLSCGRGEAVQFNCTHQTSAKNAAAVDITGWTIRVMVRDNARNVVWDKLATISNGPSGLYNFSVTHADTTIKVGTYAIDIQRTDTGSETLMGFGTFQITPEVRY
jgi:hypothetical protein